MAWQRTLNAAVDEVIDVANRENIEADIVRGGNLDVARNAAQARRLRAEVDEDREWGTDDVVVLSAAEAAERVRVDHLVLGSFNPHCARVQPAKLARGLADVVERLGVTIYEQTTVTDISPGRAETTLGVVRAPIVLRATEGFTARMRGLRRRWLPMNSAMIATEPISGDLWQSIGWAGRETMGDLAHGFFYAQRTADDRIAIGGRAVPYRYASRIDKDGVVGQGTIDYLTGVLNTILPQTRACRSRTAGAGAGRAAGLVGRGSTWTPPPVWARPAATSGTASPPRISPAARSPIWSSSGRPN